MKNFKRFSIIVLLLLVMGGIYQVGLFVLAATTDSSQTLMQSITYDQNNIQISDDILKKIKASDPVHTDQNIANYKNLLIDFNVSSTFKQEIESLILDGHLLPDILTAYAFLYYQFGVFDELRAFLTKKESGANWQTIFTDYNHSKRVFVPRSFDSDYLEKLMATPGVTTDDIMIADRVSFVADKPFEQIISTKLQAYGWKETNAVHGILFSADQLPRVQILSEQMRKYTASGELSEERVTEAFVTANQAGETPDVVIGKIKSGLSDEAILAESYIAKYYE